MYLFSFIWLAHGTKEKRGNYSFPQHRRGTEITEFMFLWEGALSSRSAHKCESLIREWDPCLLQGHKSKMFSSLFFKHCYVPFGFISVMYLMNFLRLWTQGNWLFCHFCVNVVCLARPFLFEIEDKPTWAPAQPSLWLACSYLSWSTKLEKALCL